jgi:hypothetical protein
MFGDHLYMCDDWWHCYIQKFELPEPCLHKDTLFYVSDRTATFFMEHVIAVRGKFHANDIVWAHIIVDS